MQCEGLKEEEGVKFQCHVSVQLPVTLSCVVYVCFMFQGKRVKSVCEDFHIPP